MEQSTDNLVYQKKEKINGIIYNMSPGGFNHATVNSNIHGMLKAKLKGSLCLPYMENLNLLFDNNDYFIPDIMVLCDRKHITSTGYTGVPKFVVETISPSTAKIDRSVKKARYAQKGVDEYWIIDPRSKSVEVYYLQDTDYVLQDALLLDEDVDSESYNACTEIALKAFPNVSLRLSEIFEDTL